MITEAIILAAGLSSRAKTNKMLLTVDGKTIIEDCIESFYDTCSRLILVVGHNYLDIKPVIEKYDKVNIAYNENYLDGMFSSVKEGIRNVKGERFFLTPGDYPLIKKSTIWKMANTDSDIVVPVYRGEKGHPVLIKSKFKEEILKGSFNSLLEFINLKQISVLDVNDKGVIKDVDTMEDYNNLKNFRGINDLYY